MYPSSPCLLSEEYKDLDKLNDKNCYVKQAYVKLYCMSLLVSTVSGRSAWLYYETIWGSDTIVSDTPCTSVFLVFDRVSGLHGVTSLLCYFERNPEEYEIFVNFPLRSKPSENNFDVKSDRYFGSRTLKYRQHNLNLIWRWKLIR